MLKYLNADKTAAVFDGTTFNLSGAEDWGSIGDAPTRDAVLAWLAEGNTPEPFPAPTAAQLKIAELTALAVKYNTDLRVLHANWLAVSVSDGTTEAERKALVQEGVAAVKAQSVIDRAAIIAKYA